MLKMTEYIFAKAAKLCYNMSFTTVTVKTNV